MFTGKRVPWFIVVVSLLFAAPCFGQLSRTTSLVGTVKDSTGAVVPNAGVVAVQSETSTTYRTTTNSTGDYSIPYVNIGTYTIAVKTSGFKTTQKTGILVQVNQIVRTDFTLQVGQVSQEVTVKAGAPAIATDDASVSQVVSQRQISDLPLNGRDVLELAVTTPGVYQTSNSRSGIPPGERFIGAGGRNIQNQVSMDGVSLMNNLITQINFLPSVDAIQEFHVQTGTYSAQYGGYLGVHMDLVTKSGTNQLHGAAFEFIRNDALDARQFFEKQGTPKTPFHQNQFGVEVGGPFVIPRLYNGKDKTFFMGSYEGFRELSASPSLQTVLTPLMRNGDFSEVSTPITNPLLPGNPVVTTVPVAPQAANLLKIIPAPNIAGAITNNYVASIVNNENYDVTTDRVDQNLGEKTRLFFRIAYFKDTPDYGGANSYDALYAPNSQTNWVAGYTQTISPSMVNALYVGRNSMTTNAVNNFYQNPSTQSLIKNLGIPGFPFNSANPDAPVIAIDGYLGVGNGGTNWFQTDETWEIDDQLNWIRGKQNFIIGGDLAKLKTGRTANNSPNGQFNFTGQLTGFAPADFVLGVPFSDTTPGAEVPGLVGQWRDGFFVEDNINLTPKLTLNLGLRYDVSSSPSTLNGNATILNPAQTALIPSNPPQPGFQFYTPQRNNFGPRVGFAYRVTNAWVVRGGFGIYYNPNQMNSYTFLNINPPFAPVILYQTASVTSPNLTFDNPTPGSSLTTNKNPPNVITIGPFVPTARMQQWSFDVERSLWQSAGLDVQYMGSHTYHLDRSFYSNTPPPGPGSVQSRRPNQLWGVIRTISNDEYAHYNALNVIFNQRTFHGASLRLAYTWSHNLDIGTDSNGGGYPMDAYNMSRDYASSDWDVRNRFVASYVYNLPFFQGSPSRAVQTLLANWQVNGITTLQSGFPINVTIGRDIVNTGVGHQRPDLIVTPSTNCGSGQLTNCITSPAYALPVPYNYGTAGRNMLYGPGLITFDASLFKNIPITERWNFQFRAEFFNLFNTPAFSNPSSTFGTSSFGTVGSTKGNNRQIQFAGKIIF
ncbi:MAG TPA: TonB-dependent receptor [Terriglobia bacterium]|nr:TonB-dependent receptor [Terriglobia bacterium]